MSEIELTALLITCATFLLALIILCVHHAAMTVYIGYKTSTLSYEKLKPFAYLMTLLNKENMQTCVTKVVEALYDKSKPRQ